MIDENGVSMSSTKLQQAREYEALQGARISMEERPLFHVTPTVGWLNDPNGLSFYGGAYHLFYQYNPFSVKWGPTYWGHCRSKDLLRWERLPAALAPDQVYDQAGCFSGSAVQLPDGRHLLMYTGVRREVGQDGAEQEFQTQCLAVGDGVNYEKSPVNPVITAAQLPQGGSARDFRDPKIWRDGEGWYAAVANCTEDGSGAILLYSSHDLERWQFERILDRSDNQYGRMWECPDLFELDGCGVLLTSPQELEARDPAFHSGHEVICLLGDWDQKAHTFIRRAVLPVDQGLDFYAPQTLLTPDGRRVMIGWMQAWESSKFVPEGHQWFGMLTLPRELHIQNGRLIQAPIRELEAYRNYQTAYRNILLSGAMTLPGISGRVLDLTLCLRPIDGRQCSSFTLKFAQDGRRFTALTFDPQRSLLTLDRTRSGFPYNIVHRREVPVRERGGELELRIILDRFSAEVFVNGGEQVLSAALYTPQSAQGISFEAKGAVAMDVEQYELNLV